MWHAETASLVLRHYPQAGGYERREAFRAVAFAKMLGAGVAFLEGALRVDGQPLTLSDWRDIALVLRHQHGVMTIRAKRHGRDVEFPTARAER
jgi:hypothetical protein